MSDIKFELLTVEKCFKNNFYEVPDYQREYVWAEKEVNQLMEDIHDEYTEDENKEYFIGSTVTLTLGDSSFALIDGQQRTTTLFLMLCAFRKIYKTMKLSTAIFEPCLRYTTLSKEGEEIPKNRLSLQYMQSNDVINAIIEDSKFKGQLNESGKKLFAAFGLIHEFLATRYDDPKELRVFFTYCYQKVKFIQIETDDVSRALKIFETVNERGVGLNSMDLLKNLLFRKVPLSDFPVIKDKWETIIRLLEKQKEKPLRFLRYFVMSSYNVGLVKGNEIIREDEIYTWFSSNEEKWSEKGDYFRFLQILNRNAESFTEYVDGVKDRSSHIPLQNIRYLGGTAFRQHLILLLAGQHLEARIFDHLCEQFESLMFAYLITKENARNYEARFSGWAKKLRGVTSVETYNIFLQDTIYAEFQHRQYDFETSLKTITMKGMPVYRVRYILSKLARFVESERIGGTRNISISDFMDSSFEIEHIAPNNPEEYQKQGYLNYDESKLLLGNLTLLEKSINASIGRGGFFEVKKSAYEKSSVYLTKSIAILESVGVNTSVNRVNKKLMQFERWGEAEIGKRQDILAQIALEIWKVELMK